MNVLQLSNGSIESKRNFTLKMKRKQTLGKIFPPRLKKEVEIFPCRLLLIFSVQLKSQEGRRGKIEATKFGQKYGWPFEEKTLIFLDRLVLQKNGFLQMLGANVRITFSH